MENTEVETLIASLQAGQATLPGKASKGAELALSYQRVFGTELGGEVLADLVTRFPIIAPRFVSGEPTEMAAARDGSAQVVGYILQKMISRPKQEQPKKVVKRGHSKQRETPNDIA